MSLLDNLRLEINNLRSDLRSLRSCRAELEAFIELELSGWRILSGVSSMIADTLEELKRLIPMNSGEEIYLREHENSGGWKELGFDRYAVSSNGRFSDIAYGCPECKKIIFGPPKMEAVDGIKSFCGRSGIDFYCSNCKARIYDITIDQS